MERAPDLILNGSFEFRGRISNYTVHFHEDEFIVEDEATTKKFDYTDIEKLLFNSNSLKIILKNNEKIKVPCNNSDIRKIKTLFRIPEVSDPKKVLASAAVTAGGHHFFVLITSTDIRQFKTCILEKMAKKLFPACESNGISLELFESVTFIAIGEGFEIELYNSLDLEAAVAYFNSKLRILVKMKIK